MHTLQGSLGYVGGHTAAPVARMAGRIGPRSNERDAAASVSAVDNIAVPFDQGEAEKRPDIMGLADKHADLACLLCPRVIHKTKISTSLADGGRDRDVAEQLEQVVGQCMR
jgi:hypothetical protein